MDAFFQMHRASYIFEFIYVLNVDIIEFALSEKKC